MLRDTKARHEKFKKNLEFSRIAVAFTAKVLASRGFSAHIPPDRIAEKYEDRFSCSDDGDLLAKKDGEIYHTESKRLKVEFTADSWPFKEHFIIDLKSNFDKKKVRPHMYFVWSKSLNCFGMVERKDYIHSYVDKRPSGLVDGLMVDYYIINKKYAHFVDVKW